MDKIVKENFEFLSVTIGDANIIMATAANNVDFNIAYEKTTENLVKIKEWFNLDGIGYLKQVHSDIVHVFDGNSHEGDALITNKKNTAIGIFTADCVPVFIYDSYRKVIAAVHSGWKGTLAGIVVKTLEKMKQQFSNNTSNIYIFIGPHIGSCCYNVGEDVISLFYENPIYKDIEFVKDGKLDLKACIIKQLTHNGVPFDNINSANICTLCSKQEKMHSYRRDKEKSGRMFSFIYMIK